MPIRAFLNNAVFDPEIISVMGIAFEDVCNTLELSGRTEVTKEIVATKVIRLARDGEINPIALREKVLSELDLLLPRKEP